MPNLGEGVPLPSRDARLLRVTRSDRAVRATARRDLDAGLSDMQGCVLVSFREGGGFNVSIVAGAPAFVKKLFWK